LDYFWQGPASLAYGSHLRFLLGSILVSFGILLAAGGGSWDITNHLLNRPETFFAPPHAILYSGVASAVAGVVLLVVSSKNVGKIVFPVKLSIAGVALLVSAGPVDFAWHLAFGLDGLLSPPHFVLVSGMVVSSLGGLAAMAYYKRMSMRAEERFHLHPVFIVLGILPLWLSLSGVVDMFTLPFSETRFFDFNPDPTMAVALASTGFPFVIAACLCGASALSGRRFGAMSLAGAAFVVTGALTSILPADAMHTTLPFYVLSMIPIVAADAIMSYRFWRPFAIPVYVAGAVLGLTFFMLYFPLITHTYNEFTDQDRRVWPSVTAEIYFGMMQTLYPLLIAPAAALGAVGAIAANKLVSQRRIL